jgi:uncharacterized protein
MSTQASAETIIARTRCWVERAVIGYNLCPFARKPSEAEQVRYVVSDADRAETLLQDVVQELEHLLATEADVVETTVLIHPYVLQDFLDYNDFLDVIDALLEEEEYAGLFQVASLHPDYQFAGTEPDDAENYTNRSPYPVLHLLRIDAVAKAVDAYPDPDRIPERNIELMEKLGTDKMRALLDECLKIDEDISR